MLLRNNRAFTLIELLVVVLIIGILSAIALPQYEKAVAKARFVQLQTMMNSYEKAGHIALATNGYVTDGTNYLTGTNAIADISIQGTPEGSITKTEWGDITSNCGWGYCWLNFSGKGKYAGVTINYEWGNSTHQSVFAASSSQNAAMQKVLCEWANSYSSNVTEPKCK